MKASWLLVILLVLFFIVAFRAFAAPKTKVTCYWKSCDVELGLNDARTGLVYLPNVSSCVDYGYGLPEAMLSEERRLRHAGKVFLRECAFGDEKPVLTWGDK